MDPVAALAAGSRCCSRPTRSTGSSARPAKSPPARLYELKGRAHTQPTAIARRDVDALLDAVPELDADLLRAPARAVHARRPRTPPALPMADGGRAGRSASASRSCRRTTRDVVDAVGIVLATSANDPGGPNPVTLDDVPRRIRDGCGAELDLGPLPGIPSTVIDLTHDEPRILREGAVPATEALRRLRA